MTEPVGSTADLPPLPSRPESYEGEFEDVIPLADFFLYANAIEERFRTLQAELITVKGELDAANFDVFRACSALSCIRVSVGIGEARTDLQSALVIPAEVIHQFRTIEDERDAAIAKLNAHGE